MKFTTANHIDAAEEDYLYTQDSQLPQAGQGLFTGIPIFKDEVIAIFKGEVLSASQVKNRADAGNDKYFIVMQNGKIMDSMHTPCFAKFANDAKGTMESHFKNNTKIMMDEANQICIAATRNIKANEELFCSYGKNYWKKHGITL